METRTIRTTYPCCGKRAIFEAVAALPKQTYDRRCRKEDCDVTYFVERRSFTIKGVGIADVLDWTDTNTYLYTRLYGEG